METEINIEKLQKQIDTLTEMIEWVNRNLKASERSEFFKELVTQRRVLKGRKRILSVNPTIAAYGESQKGKSYIVTSLLSSPGKPVMVKDETGGELDFIDNYNRKTKNQESTGVITRFTTDVVSTDEKHPFRIQTLSAADLITMMAEIMISSKGFTPYQNSEVEEMGRNLVQKYQDKKNVQSYLTEDEVWDIRDYIVSKESAIFAAFESPASNWNSGWFDCMAQVVRRIPFSDWAEVFSPLWFGNETLTKFLNQVFSMYSRLEFATELFIDSKPLLNALHTKSGRNDGAETLMSVAVLTDTECGLKKFYDKGGEASVNVQVSVPSKGITATVDKAFLSFITAEVVYHIDSESLMEKIEFNFEGIRPVDGQSKENIVNMLRDNGIDAPLQRTCLYRDKDRDVCFDLLDFPGARVVGTIASNKIENELAETMLREKVVYLFGKYSSEQRLSILMICHDEENSNKLMPDSLEKWVMQFVGKTPEERKRRISDYKVSPLFLISTKYNRDLVVGKSHGEWRMDSDVFKRRLQEKLLNEVIMPESHDWFYNWVAEGKSFDNTFLLRDYVYSSKEGKDGTANGLFAGYNDPQIQHEVEEFDIEERKQIKERFLSEPAAKIFFPNPELAWDVASTIGNDGSYYLFKRLMMVAPNVLNARANYFAEDINKAIQKAVTTIGRKFHGDDNSELLKESVMSAKRLDFSMRYALERHEDFFGRFIQYLQLTSNFTSELFSNIIHSTTIPTVVSVSEYELILKGLHEKGLHFKKGDYDGNIKVLERAYGFVDPSIPPFNSIDLNVLFGMEFIEKKTASGTLAKALVEKWLDVLMSPESCMYFTQIGFPAVVLSDFLTRFKNMVEHVALANHIAEAISEYVDFTADIENKNLPLISDVATNIFNSFVMDMGYSYLDAKEQQDVKTNGDACDLPISISSSADDVFDYSNDDVVSGLFLRLEELGKGDGGQLTHLPSYKNLKQWVQFAAAAYLANFQIEDWGYTPEENAKLGKLLEQLK